MSLRDYRRSGRSCARIEGVSLVELLIVVAIVGLLGSIAVPVLLTARRQANQASAVASLHAIADAQHAFAASCGRGLFASRLSHLAAPAAEQPGFLAPDLTADDTVSRSGYRLTMGRGTDGTRGEVDACNGVSGGDLTSSFYATASPLSGIDGIYHYWIGVDGLVFAGIHVIGTTAGLAAPPGAQPVDEGGGVRRQRRGQPAEAPAVP